LTLPVFLCCKRKESRVEFFDELGVVDRLEEEGEEIGQERFCGGLLLLLRRLLLSTTFTVFSRKPIKRYNFVLKT
jgi:hypothetical protein